ncbi:hypothetical protein EW146_g188 [Bondarzewia mesenterica]|uniref:Uncharacterized protein n=1 Tax=Bondarzewia mesenterica TaxID=1095465 RepID=A0A4S4M990_9AGAM|nr:hypothetical protein EW146_g188 [Bondarzewia mesenterica]
MPVGGFDLTMDEARDMLHMMPNGIQLLESGKENHEFMKKKGSLGIATLLLMANKVVDITRIVLPSQQVAQTMQQADNWGQDWFVLTKVMRLAMHLQTAPPQK